MNAELNKDAVDFHNTDAQAYALVEAGKCKSEAECKLPHEYKAFHFRNTFPDRAEYIAAGKTVFIAPTPATAAVAPAPARVLSKADDDQYFKAVHSIRIMDSNLKSAEEHRARILGEGEPANTRCYRDGRPFGSGAGHEVATAALAVKLARLNGTPIPKGAPSTSSRPRSERREISFQRTGITSLQAQLDRANGHHPTTAAPVAYREPRPLTNRDLGVRELQSKIDAASRR